MSATRRRWLWLILAIPVAIGVMRLRLDVEVLNLLPADLPEVHGLKLYQEHFANAGELVVTVSAPTPEQAEDSARRIAAALRAETNIIREVTWQPPWMEHPLDAAEFVGWLWLNQPPGVVAELTNRLAPHNLASILESTREALTTSLSPDVLGRLARDPYNLLEIPNATSSGNAAFGRGEEIFVSPDGTFRLVFVQANTDLRSYRDCARWLEAVRRIVESTGISASEATMRFTGRPAFVSEIASGMERDINKSVGGTALLVALFFWLAHRQFRPLALLLGLLTLVLGSTFAIGGLIFGTLSVVSMGFAAILLGLAVDYALVAYEEHVRSPAETADDIRRKIGPSVFWSAVTTSGAFLLLNAAGLPGLGQLGTLVAVGVVVAAFVMTFLFLPVCVRFRNPRPTDERGSSRLQRALDQPRLVWILTALTLVFAGSALLRSRPRLDPSPEALRPRHSEAHAALDELKARMQREREPLWVIAEARNSHEMADRLEHIDAALAEARHIGAISDFAVPKTLWPREEHQRLNRSVAAGLAAQRTIMVSNALAHGFTEAALEPTHRILDLWQESALGSPSLFPPSNDVTRWLLKQAVSREDDRSFAISLAYPANVPLPTTSEAPQSNIAQLKQLLGTNGVWVTGWEPLGAALFERVMHNVARVLVPMAIVLIVCLWLAFRRVAEVVLALSAMTFAGLCLWAAMSLAGWSWNLLNLMALPLLLGAGVDYTIHVLLALRRENGNVPRVRATTGRALLLCAATTTAGFGSLAWSNNAGLASLGRVCAIGIAFAFVSAVLFLPVWWRTFTPGTADAIRTANLPGSTTTPSVLYRSGLWSAAQRVVARLPESAAVSLASLAVRIYQTINRSRRNVVVQNLTAVFNGDTAAATAATSKLFQNFARKLVHLWRYESGHPIDSIFGAGSNWDRFAAAQAKGRGVLLLTPHLGNWEFGAPMLRARGVSLQVITLAEPDAKLTQMREAARARWGIETLVIGNDEFGFVEVIRRLETGATIALLVDRPARDRAFEVTLFGQPFAASMAPAELARASGCVLLPVLIPWEGTGYAARVLPEIEYDRAALRSREARHELTVRIMAAFEPAIRKYAAQWYHFIPVRPK